MELYEYTVHELMDKLQKKRDYNYRHYKSICR